MFRIMVHGIHVEESIGQWCKICVSVYAFITGYVACASDSYRTFRSRLGKIVKLLISYWVILGFIYLMGILVREPMPDAVQFLLEMVGAHTDPTVMRCTFSWYIYFYIEVLLLLIPLLNMLRHGFNGKPAAIFLFPVMILAFGAIVRILYKYGLSQIGPINNFFYYGQIVVAGFCFAYFGLFDRMNSYLGRALRRISGPIRRFTFLILMLAVILLRFLVFSGSLNLDVLYVPALIFLLFKLTEVRNERRLAVRARNILTALGTFLGRNSMNIWLLHSIFFTPEKSLQWIAYLPYYGVPIVAWVLVICSGISVVLGKVQKALTAKAWTRF